MAALIVTVSLICFFIPLIIKIIAKQRNSGVVPSVDTLLESEQMEGLYPAKLWENIKQNEDGETCAICLDDFTSESMVRQLGCLHCFHVACIDNWAANKASCPLCKGGLGAQQEQPVLRGGGTEENWAEAHLLEAGNLEANSPEDDIEISELD